MDKLTRERAERLVFWFSLISAIIALVVVLVLVTLEVYVRWAMSQNFTFLGGNELAALTVSVFGLILGMAYIHRPVK